jgi:3-oxoacyl-[acyl-carrier protein] reductase
MDLGLTGRTAIVTAASSGLGFATAMELGIAGANLIITSRGRDKLDRAAGQIRSATGVDVRSVPGDVTDANDVEQLVRSTERAFGHVDILVANAGGPPLGVFDDFTNQDYRDALELNLISTINLCRQVVPSMRESNWGRILAIMSVAAKQPMDNFILSNTSRAGVLGFMKSLSKQVAPYGITVNTLCPGYHRTERVEQLASEDARKEGLAIEQVYTRIANAIPMGRIGEPEEFAAVAAFLCSKRASYVTGTVIQVDGGVYRGLF